MAGFVKGPGCGHARLHRPSNAFTLSRALYAEGLMVEHRVIREGVVAGLIGATVVAVWFFIIDLIAGHPLFTPQALGQALMTALPGPSRGEGALQVIMLYTVFHYAAFFVLGMIAVGIIHASEREPSVLAGFLILFVAFEVGFYLFIMLIQRSLLGNIAWYQIGVANVLAAVFMGRYLVRAHPEVVGRMDHALGDTELGSS